MDSVQDIQIVQHINELVGDYRYLERQHGGLGLSTEQRAQLADLQVQIDQSWDLLRRCRARRYSGVNPSVVDLRSGPGGRDKAVKRTSGTSTPSSAAAAEVTRG